MSLLLFGFFLTVSCAVTSQRFQTLHHHEILSLFTLEIRSSGFRHGWKTTVLWCLLVLPIKHKEAVYVTARRRWNQWLEAFPFSVTCTWTQWHNSLPDHAASSEAPDVSRTAFHFVWATATARLITALPLTQPRLRVRVHVSVWMSERVKIL